MLPYHQHICLSGDDLALFATLTGKDLPPPTSVSDFNERLLNAASAWRQGRSQEESLLVEIAEGLLLNESPAAAVITVNTPASSRH